MNESTRFPVAQAIRERRTVRQFRPDPVDRALLLELMEIACWTPNHGMREPWRFILYLGGARRAFAEAVLAGLSVEEREKYGSARTAYLDGIPVHLVVTMAEDPRQKQWVEDFSATSSWIQSFQLAAWERGLGVVWKTNNYMYHPGFREAVGVRPGERVVGVLHVGYPEAVPDPKPRTPLLDKLTVYEA